MDITITDVAKKKLVDYGVGEDNKFLRITVKNGGCSGLKFDAVIDETFAEQDTVIVEDETLKIVADQGSLFFINGLTVDFSDDLIQGGFKLTNKAAQGSCGCGASFEPYQ